MVTVQFVGHATVLLELDGVRVLTDPLLRTRVAHLRRLVPLEWSPGPLDAVLLSHLHRDHADLPSLRRLDRSTRLVVPRGAGPFLRRHGFERVIELEEGDSVDVGRLHVGAARAVHDGRRHGFGAHVAALGYVLTGSRSVYFAGDTEPFAGMAELGGLDVALLPVAGWGPRLGPGHLDPTEAAGALRVLRPRVAIPIHWGTYLPGYRLRRYPGDPPAEFVAAAKALAPEVEVRVLRPGERTTV
jgi:L-ascorbate metabolism protein UlaG (beta-lactamase superfamily)